MSPYKEKDIVEVYKNIGDIAELIGISTSHIRYLCYNFNVYLKFIKRNKNNFRKFDKVQTGRLLELVLLTHEDYMGVQLKAAKKAVNKHYHTELINIYLKHNPNIYDKFSHIIQF